MIGEAIKCSGHLVHMFNSAQNQVTSKVNIVLGNQFCFTFLLTCPHRDGSRAQSNGGPVITYEDAYQGNGTRDLRQTFDSERSTDDVTNVVSVCFSRRS